MASRTHPRNGVSNSTAVLVRLVAFVLATIGILTIPATIVAAGSGHVTHQEAFIAIVAAVALIAGAAIIVRPFDPLRG